MSGPLSGLRVFDLTRILAGPSCTQILGDLGADVIKVEMPGKGDDTRGFAPPYLKNGDGQDTDQSACFTCANRNKRSITLDLTKPEGVDIAKRMIAKSDVLAENFKTGGLAKYGLGYDQLKDDNPGLVYCSVTGFGHTGPYANRPGYDVLIQGMGGFMSTTGEPDGPPQKAGISKLVQRIIDCTTGHLHTGIADFASKTIGGNMAMTPIKQQSGNCQPLLRRTESGVS